MKLIPYGKHFLDEDDFEAVLRVLKSGTLTQGPFVEKFEHDFCEYLGVKHAVAVSSATAGLHLANIILGVRQGLTVVTSPITFVATANATRMLGGQVLLADIERETANISPQSLARVLEKNKSVRAIVPVHFAGLPCDMEEIKRIADFYSVSILEDACHALGATYSSGKKVGSCEHSAITVFSLHPVKSIAAGEGGVVTTNDTEIYKKLLRLRSHGINKLDDKFISAANSKSGGLINPWYYEMQELGYNYRLTDIQAALAASQLKKLDSFILQRQKLSKRYEEGLLHLKNCKPLVVDSLNQSSRHLFVLKINFENTKKTRAKIMCELKDRGINTQVHYMPINMHPYYSELDYGNEKLINAVEYYNEALTIPLFYDLTLNQQDFIINSIREVIG